MIKKYYLRAFRNHIQVSEPLATVWFDFDKYINHPFLMGYAIKRLVEDVESNGFQFKNIVIKTFIEEEHEM